MVRDPYAWWCGRKGVVRLLTIPIIILFQTGVIVHKGLSDLPLYTVTRIEETGDELRLSGQFDHLKTVRGVPRRSWLYAPPNSIIGDLISVDTETFAAIFLAHSSDKQFVSGIGARFPWLDGYWNAALIQRILENTDEWRQVVFEPNDTTEFIQDGVRGWCKVGRKVPDGAQIIGSIEGGWDHEHCELCQQKIGLGGEGCGYTDIEDNWLCPSCYKSYGANGNLAFLFEG